MKINLIKAGAYTFLGAGVGTVVIVPNVAYFRLLKKTEELDELLKKSKENLEQANKELEEAKNDETKDKENTTKANKKYSDIIKETETLKVVNKNLITKARNTISIITGIFNEINRKNNSGMRSFYEHIKDYDDLAKTLQEEEKKLSEQ